jgi:hypothetical protein
MMTPNSRALRLALLAALVGAAFSFSAKTASAQWADPVCGDPNTVQTAFSGFNFNGMDKCESLCKQSGSLCRSLVKDATNCNQFSWKGYWNLFDNTNCDTQTDPASRKSCHAEVTSVKNEEHDSLNNDRDAALALCTMSQATCIANCAPL